MARFTRHLWLAAIALAAASATDTARAAGITGDQLLFFYDGRSGRVTFFGVSNPSTDSDVTVDVVFYPASLEGRLGRLRTTLPPLGHTVIDPTTAAEGVAIGNTGLAVVTPVGANGNPVVPDEPLVGTSTLANVPLDSAFGENPIGRSATTSDGGRPSPGTIVDGASAFYERLRPSTLLVPVFFNPAELGPADQDGNRVVLIAFTDRYGDEFDVGPHRDTVEATFFDASGSSMAETSVAVQGVRTTHLQEIAGPTELSASGKVFFEVDAGAGNVAGIFSQSLGPFGAGQRMPEVFGDETSATALDVGATSGDQLLFFYDGRSGRVPFLSIGNPSPASSVTIEVAFHSESLEDRLGVATYTLAPSGHVIVDPNQAAGGVAIGNAGLAVVTAVDAGSGRPVVPPEPLVGTSTLANIPLESAFGDNAIGRLAVDGDGERASPGTEVDGETVAFQRLAPSMLAVPVFFNPTQLGPVENDGNRVVLVAFRDEYGPRFDVAARTETVDARIFGADGSLVSASDVTVRGVLATNVQAIASPVALDASGKIVLDVDASGGSVFGLFSQSLGPFGAGHRLPAIDVGDLPGPTPRPDASPTPVPTTGSTPSPSATPMASAAPSATPSPPPAPTASPTPSPTPPGSTIGGIPQSACRDGIIDAGEECDDGAANFECKNDPEFQSICGPGTTSGWTCAYCAQTYLIGSPDILVPCGGSGTVLVTIQPLADRTCSTIGLGTVASCGITLGPTTTETICPEITNFVQPSGNRDDLLEKFRSTTCLGRACVERSSIIGDCLGKSQGAPCTLIVGGQPAFGTCLGVRSGSPICIGETVSLAN